MELPDAPPRASAAVARFLLGSLAAIAVVVVGGFFALRSVAIREADLAGADRVSARASGPRGVTCRATATLAGD